ncbi:MAG TPA: C25 family cysteine peptidase, partial [Ignavibacteriaceae bacterium]
MTSKIFIILLLISTPLLFSQRDIKVLSSDFNSITIEYSPKIIDSSYVTVDGKTFRKVEISSGILKNYNDWGMPSIIERNLNVGVPSEVGNTITVLSSVYKELSGQILPVPYPVQDTFSVSFDYKQNSDYSGFKSIEDIVTFGEYGLLRDVPMQTINISPIKFDPASNKIKLYTKIIFRIDFSNQGIISSKPADDLIDGILINYDVAKYWNKRYSDKSLNKVAVENSVLASGKWVKFEAPEEGIYKISKANLALFGIDANAVDPRTIKIYNNGGKVYPENITSARPIDLVENAILVVGQEDGKFDDADYILFYGRGSSFWDFDTDGSTIKRFKNPYSTKNYFWITSGSTNGKRIIEKPGLTTTPALIQTSSSAYADWEIDKINLGKTGRQFFGDDFSSSVTSRTYTNSLNGRINGTPINYNLRFAIGSPSGLNLTVTENGNQLFQRNLAGYGSTSYTAGIANIWSFVFNGNLPDNRSVLNFSVIPSGVSAVGYLDYFTIQYEKELKAFGDNLLFYSSPSGGLIEYQLNGFTSSNIRVFDITDFSNVRSVSNYVMQSGSEVRFQFDESLTQRTKYYAVGSDAFKTPSNPVEVQNSNLRGEEPGAKFIIVTNKAFKEAANNLKNYRENQALVTISTYVADIDQIYNEFSGGTMDPTALRDYLKYAFDNWTIKPQYVLLFGKGTYDYQNIEKYGDNFVVTWQSDESLSLLNSYTTDDFFGRLSGDDNTVDIALGRITCANPNEANAMVNKIIDYELN